MLSRTTSRIARYMPGRKVGMGTLVLAPTIAW